MSGTEEADQEAIALSTCANALLPLIAAGNHAGVARIMEYFRVRFLCEVSEEIARKSRLLAEANDRLRIAIEQRKEAEKDTASL